MKNNSLLTCLSVTVLLGALALPALAQNPPRHSVQERLNHQSKRIREGVATGQLTRREAARLRARNARIRYQHARARMTGGHITHAEHRRMEHELDRTSKTIHHDKHDTQHR